MASKLLSGEKCPFCGTEVIGCRHCVVLIPIDPETGMPPFLTHDADGEPSAIVPTAEALARSEEKPICDQCANAIGIKGTWRARHAQGCRGDRQPATAPEGHTPA